MVEQIKTYPISVLAVEVIDSFTEKDEQYVRKLFNEKLEENDNDLINILLRFDEAKISKTHIKVFFEDMLFALRNYKHLGHLAIVAHSKVLKALVPIDNLFFERASKGRKEQYFDVSQLEEAFAFVEEENQLITNK